jgi:hypothetical protein
MLPWPPFGGERADHL